MEEVVRCAKSRRDVSGDVAFNEIRAAGFKDANFVVRHSAET